MLVFGKFWTVSSVGLNTDRASVDDVHPNDLPAEDLDAMKQIGLLEILIYRHEDSRGMKTTLKTLTEVIQEVPEKIFKGQAISHSAK